MRQFTSYVFDLRTQATSNTRAIGKKMHNA